MTQSISLPKALTQRVWAVILLNIKSSISLSKVKIHVNFFNEMHTYPYKLA